MDVGSLGGLHHLVHGGLPAVVAVTDVLGQGGVEKDRLLRHDAHPRPDPRHVEGLDVVTVDVLLG